VNTVRKKEHAWLALLWLCLAGGISASGAEAEEQKIFPEKKIAGSQIVRIG
jgi:hypothetical protein